MQITHNPSQNRYELMLDGHLSWADYELNGNTLSITHVVVAPELRGKGVAADLMKAVVDDAKARGLTIIPVCSYAQTYMARQS